MHHISAWTLDDVRRPQTVSIRIHSRVAPIHAAEWHERNRVETLRLVRAASVAGDQMSVGAIMTSIETFAVISLSSVLAF
jgi:hypothetical protein